MPNEILVRVLIDGPQITSDCLCALQEIVNATMRKSLYSTVLYGWDDEMWAQVSKPILGAYQIREMVTIMSDFDYKTLDLNLVFTHPNSLHPFWKFHMVYMSPRPCIIRVDPIENRTNRRRTWRASEVSTIKSLFFLSPSLFLSFFHNHSFYSFLAFKPKEANRGDLEIWEGKLLAQSSQDQARLGHC